MNNFRLFLKNAGCFEKFALSDDFYAQFHEFAIISCAHLLPDCDSFRGNAKTSGPFISFPLPPSPLKESGALMKFSVMC